jgi:hypothetical protein
MVWEHIVLPVLAIVVLGLLEVRATGSLVGWLVNLGWDSSVLALGAAPAIFLSSNAQKLFGSDTDAVHWGYVFVLTTIAVTGVFVGALRSNPIKREWHAICSVMIGGALLGALIYVAKYDTPRPLRQQATVTSIHMGQQK